MPEKVFKKLNTFILPQWKVCFLTALLTGLFAHLYKITNWLPNWDSLVFRYDSQNMIGLGRWFLPVVCSVSSFYDLPLLNGIIAIIFHGLGAVCVCRILNVKNKITAGLIGGIIVSFPTVTSVMMYNYVADGYSIGFFMSALAAYYMTKEKPRYVFAGVLIAFSSGIYQAYITVAIMLSILHLIDETIYERASLGKIFKKAVCMLLSGLLGMVLYSVILKISLLVFSAELSNYQGINSGIGLSAINIPGALYMVKETFIKCFFDVSEGINLYIVLNVFVTVFTLVHYLKYIQKNRLYKTPSKIFIIAILGVLLILGAGALAFINSGIDYHNLMLMGYAVFYIFFLILYERGGKQDFVKCWIILITASLMIGNQVVISNVSYHKAQMAYEKSYGVLIRIADRIDEMPEAEACEKILVIGALDNSMDYSVNLTPDITGITDGYIIRKDDETVGQSVLTSALNDYCGKNYDFIRGEDKKIFLQREDVKSMGTWPSKECIKVIDNTVVLKLGAEGEE